MDSNYRTCFLQCRIQLGDLSFFDGVDLPEKQNDDADLFLPFFLLPLILLSLVLKKNKNKK